ncbi:hypothetical protein HYW59_01290 [Candidatus Kaiserbacteria bacterium]|nr:hypothetical protein [Candidatus Kaiserbacteria bacterium]
MEEQIQNLEKEIAALKERNRRVEGDKAWETSYFRVSVVAIIVYIVVAIFLYVIGVQNFLLAALVPPVGYFLSTRSLPAIKRWWIKTFLQ